MQVGDLVRLKEPSNHGWMDFTDEDPHALFIITEVDTQTRGKTVYVGKSLATGAEYYLFHSEVTTEANDA